MEIYKSTDPFSMLHSYVHLTFNIFAGKTYDENIIPRNERVKNYENSPECLYNLVHVKPYESALKQNGRFSSGENRV